MTTEKTVEKTDKVVYVVARCPHCGTVFTDYMYKHLQLSDQYIQCPICGRVIVPGGEDEGDDFE
jgi:ribosomal protein S27E